MSMLQGNQRRVTASGRRGARTRRLGLALVVLLAILLAACADDESNRQFANDPKTPRPTATQPPGTPTSAVAAAARPAASPQALVDRRGAPRAAWWQAGGALWAFGDGSLRPVVEGDALAYAPSPDGSLVAVVTAQGTSYRIDIYTLEGERVERFDAVLDVPSAGATPAAAGAAGTSPVVLDWSPQGNRLLLAHQSGVLVDVPLDGKARRIETRVPLEGISQVGWSPRGEVIAVLVRDESGTGSLALVDPAAEPATVDVIAPVGRGTDGTASVEAFDWKPRGGGLVFIQAKRSDAGASGGMVVAWDRSTNSTQILATGAQGGPTGSVTWLSVAPDGKAVAYIVSIPGEEGGSFVGLFVRSLVDGQLYRLPVDADATVLRTWWLKDGLAWIAVMSDPSGASAEELVYIDGTGARESLGTIGAPPGATPAASPVAGTPMASPVSATPAASPAASPGASPVLATPAG